MTKLSACASVVVGVGFIAMLSPPAALVGGVPYAGSCDTSTDRLARSRAAADGLCPLRAKRDCSQREPFPSSQPLALFIVASSQRTWACAVDRGGPWHEEPWLRHRPRLHASVTKGVGHGASK